MSWHGMAGHITAGRLISFHASRVTKRAAWRLRLSLGNSLSSASVRLPVFLCLCSSVEIAHFGGYVLNQGCNATFLKRVGVQCVQSEFQDIFDKKKRHWITASEVKEQSEDICPKSVAVRPSSSKKLKGPSEPTGAQAATQLLSLKRRGSHEMGLCLKLRPRPTQATHPTDHVSPLTQVSTEKVRERAPMRLGKMFWVASGQKSPF